MSTRAVYAVSVAFVLAVLAVGRVFVLLGWFIS